MKHSLTLLLAAGALAACASPLNGPNEAAPIAQQHPIAVEQQTVALTIAVDPSLSELSAIDKARIAAFADTYFTRGHGPITITAPSGGQDDFYGEQVAADIRNALYERGLAYEAMQGATYRQAPTGEPEVIVSFSNYVASPSECGAWDEEFIRRSRNLNTKNFGCASQNNLAAMVADPRDLIEAGRLGPADAARNSVVMEAYRNGEVTSSEADPNTDVQASDQ